MAGMGDDVGMQTSASFVSRLAAATVASRPTPATLAVPAVGARARSAGTSGAGPRLATRLRHLVTGSGLGAGLGLLVLAGCASQQPSQRVQPGQNETAVLATLGPPTNRYALPEAGGQRLEYARGPQGFETWMVDLDPSGRVRQVEQVLGARRFAEVKRGMTEAQLLRLLGRPAERQREYMDRETFYWRYNPYECIWFAVTLSPQRRVLDSSNGLPDPRCDASQ